MVASRPLLFFDWSVANAVRFRFFGPQMRRCDRKARRREGWRAAIDCATEFALAKKKRSLCKVLVIFPGATKGATIVCKKRERKKENTEKGRQSGDNAAFCPFFLFLGKIKGRGRVGLCYILRPLFLFLSTVFLTFFSKNWGTAASSATV
ncbi:hypothetical protein TW95_gp1287 [Pandoravirus inopinatum]|uniref:Transmembrane protein n=1 Tax=Pandoravirus inopinatum TaxID=1605721 RepID=A0A0B5JAN3_9VIRU|nr:hypothetical protein TW95_gp1287 [Pandoravirus inopinatum]AJF98021.1 hypothetical protein [Pandoravirus inopinatum]